MIIRPKSDKNTNGINSNLRGMKILIIPKNETKRDNPKSRV
jgi:hypothetical protein